MRTRYRSAFAVASGFCVSTPAAPKVATPKTETASIRPQRGTRPADTAGSEAERLAAA